jgi:type I restriction enzyme S subunit
MDTKNNILDNESAQLPAGWAVKRLGDVVEITSSKRIFAKEYVTHGIPFYRGKEIIEKHRNNEVSTEIFITHERFDEIKSKYGAPDSGDLLLTSVGTLGIPYVVKDGEKFYFKDGNLTWFQSWKGLNNKFLYYWFKSDIGSNAIYKIAIGSTQQAITIQALSNLEIKRLRYSAIGV